MSIVIAGSPKMTIDGRSASGVDEFNVVNPATGEPCGRAPNASVAQADEAFEAADRSYHEWRLDAPTRIAALDAAAVAIDCAADELAATLTAEQGKPLRESRQEVAAAAGAMRYYAGLELPREVIQDDEHAFVEVVRRPLGPVAAIAPWNFPIGLAATKIAPALRAGNTIVLKPSPFTPLTTLRLGELLQDCFPAGVVNIISGGDQLGALMTRHPLARKVSFTGSVETGKRVAQAAAVDLKRVTLELGGNDPAIVLDDADPAEIADALFDSAFANNGQVCLAVKRVYVPEPLHDELVDALSARASAARVGDGTTEETDLGPLQNRPQLERVAELVADAIHDGGTPASGGRRAERDGYFFEPTILIGVGEGTRIVDEEQFGPALPVIKYRDLGDAVTQANASMFGLGASVWTSDPERGSEVAERIESGTTWINTHLRMVPGQPFGGAKWSGLGVENGRWGLYGFTDLRVVHRAR